jgi:hypothetical protein
LRELGDDLVGSSELEDSRTYEGEGLRDLAAAIINVDEHYLGARDFREAFGRSFGGEIGGGGGVRRRNHG